MKMSRKSLDNQETDPNKPKALKSQFFLSFSKRKQ